LVKTFSLPTIFGSVAAFIIAFAISLSVYLLSSKSAPRVSVISSRIPVSPPAPSEP